MEGYALSGDGRTCEGMLHCIHPYTYSALYARFVVSTTDVDECASGLALCQQNCTNRVGNYTCSCKEGYEPVGKYNCTGAYL